MRDVYEGRNEGRGKGAVTYHSMHPHRAINSIVFAGDDTNPLLVLAGDEAIFIWKWKQLLAILEQPPGNLVIKSSHRPCLLTNTLG